MSSSQNSENSSEKIYRVNRLGQEIFSGNLAAFEAAVYARRIRADDLIFDEETQTWGFAKQHKLFIKLLGQGVEELTRSRETSQRTSRFIRFLLSILIVSGILYILINYSKRIEFRQNEASFDVNSNSVLPTESDQITESEEGMSGDGEGGDSEMGMGLLEVPTKKKVLRSANGEEIELVFDLSSVEMKEILELVKHSEKLSDKVLMKLADEISRSKSYGREAFTNLQKAIAYVEFISHRSVHQSGKSNKGADLLLAKLNAKLDRQCKRLYSPKLCILKRQYPKWNIATLQSILNKQVLLGMTLEQSKKAWGENLLVKRVPSGAQYCYEKSCDQFFIIGRESRVIQMSVDKK